MRGISSLLHLMRGLLWAGNLLYARFYLLMRGSLKLQESTLCAVLIEQEITYARFLSANIIA